MNQRGSILLFVLIGILVLVLVGTGIYYSSSNRSPVATVSTSQLAKSSSKSLLVLSPTPTISISNGTISSTTSAVLDSTTWKKYTDNKFNFSIKYPSCSTIQCLNVFPENNTILQNDPQNTGYGITIPTGDNNAWIDFSIMSNKETNTLIQDMLTPGPNEGDQTYSVTELSNALALPIGSNCKSIMVENLYSSCSIVMLSGKKAIKILGLHNPISATQTNEYFVNLANSWWMSIAEQAFASQTETFSQQFSEDDQVLATLKFI